LFAPIHQQQTYDGYHGKACGEGGGEGKLPAEGALAHSTRR
jgi:hypothetical protein